MKNTLVLLILLALVSCNNSKKETQTNLDQQSDFEVEYLEGYFPKNDIEFDAEVKALVIANQTDFDKYFGIAQTMNNKVPAIDFEKTKLQQ